MGTIGGLRTWGLNFRGELGNNSNNNSNFPVAVQGLAGGVVAVAANGTHMIALKPDGTVVAWGSNDKGQLGNNSLIDSDVPVPVSGLTGAVAVAVGNAQSLALKGDGTVWAWGYNNHGQLGNGTSTDSHVPVAVSGLTGVVAIAAGAFHSLALKGDGTVAAWGLNSQGQLGDGTTTSRSTPVAVSGLSGVSAVAGGAYHSLALKSGGMVAAWGSNASGELGNGDNVESHIPVAVVGSQGPLASVAAVAAGSGHSLAVKTDGTVVAWGGNRSGQLGDGTTANRSVAVVVAGLSVVTAIAGGETHSLAVKSDGTVAAWGNNNFGELGNGSLIDSLVPMNVPGLRGVSAIAAGFGDSVAFVSPTITVDGYTTAEVPPHHPWIHVLEVSGSNFSPGQGVVVEVHRDTMTGPPQTSGTITAGSDGSFFFQTVKVPCGKDLAVRVTDLAGNAQSNVEILAIDCSPSFP